MRVVQFAAPTYDEKRHHWLWRFWPALPGWGGMAVLDRSWYGRVLVERVEKFATKEQWTRAYDEINEFERIARRRGDDPRSSSGMHVSDEEQLKRFEARSDDPLKSWKLTDEDWRNRKKRKQYEAAIEDMLERTDTERGAVAPVEGDSKRWARVKVDRDACCERIEARALAQRLRCALRACFWARVFLRARSFSRWRRWRSCGSWRRRSASALRGSSCSVLRASREIHQPMKTKKTSSAAAIR